MDIKRNCMSIQKFQKNYKFEVLSKKTDLFFRSISSAKVWKSLESLETGFSEHSEISEISEIVLFQNFQKLQKNDIKLELQKSRKTCSDSKTESKTDSKVWLKVRNAGP